MRASTVAAWDLTLSAHKLRKDMIGRIRGIATVGTGWTQAHELIIAALRDGCSFTVGGPIREDFGGSSEIGRSSYDLEIRVYTGLPEPHAIRNCRGTRERPLPHGRGSESAREQAGG